MIELASDQMCKTPTRAKGVEKYICHILDSLAYMCIYITVYIGGVAPEIGCWVLKC